MNPRRSVVLITLAVSTVLACGSSGTSTSSSGTSGTSGSTGDECGVSGTKTLAEVSDAEKGTLCDCTNQLEGGYGKSFPCEGGLSLSNKKDQAACVAAWTPCKNATVADGIACAHAIVEHDRCDLNGAIGDPRCAYIGSCQK